jgi:hypothetical protein
LLSHIAVDAIYSTAIKPLLLEAQGVATHNQSKQNLAKKEFGNAFAHDIQVFAPAAGLVNFFTNTVPTMITGKKPQGSNFIEKTQSGLDMDKQLINKLK